MFNGVYVDGGFKVVKISTIVKAKLRKSEGTNIQWQEKVCDLILLKWQCQCKYKYF